MNEHTDICIIGGGMAGLSAAVALAGLDQSIIVLDKGRVVEEGDHRGQRNAADHDEGRQEYERPEPVPPADPGHSACHHLVGRVEPQAQPGGGAPWAVDGVLEVGVGRCPGRAGGMLTGLA